MPIIVLCIDFKGLRFYFFLLFSRVEFSLCSFLYLEIGAFGLLKVVSFRLLLYSATYRENPLNLIFRFVSFCDAGFVLFLCKLFLEEEWRWK